MLREGKTKNVAPRATPTIASSSTGLEATRLIQAAEVKPAVSYSAHWVRSDWGRLSFQFSSRRGQPGLTSVRFHRTDRSKRTQLRSSCQEPVRHCNLLTKPVPASFFSQVPLRPNHFHPTTQPPSFPLPLCSIPLT